jgi:hypothetical protein
MKRTRYADKPVPPLTECKRRELIFGKRGGLIEPPSRRHEEKTRTVLRRTEDRTRLRYTRFRSARMRKASACAVPVRWARSPIHGARRRRLQLCHR